MKRNWTLPHYLGFVIVFCARVCVCVCPGSFGWTWFEKVFRFHRYVVAQLRCIGDGSSSGGNLIHVSASVCVEIGMVEPSALAAGS